MPNTSNSSGGSTETKSGSRPRATITALLSLLLGAVGLAVGFAIQIFSPPTNVLITRTIDLKTTLDWTPPGGLFSPEGYEISVTSNTNQEEVYRIIEKKSTHTIPSGKLDPDVEYSVHLKTIFPWRNSRPIDRAIHKEGKPENVIFTDSKKEDIGYNFIKIGWAHNEGGKKIKYQVNVKKGNQEIAKEETDNKHFTFLNLCPKTKYTFSVIAFYNGTKYGSSPEKTSRETLEMPPVEDPKEIREKSGYDSIHLSWNHPAPSDSNVQYEISYNGKSFETKEKSYTIQNLEPEKSYNFSIVAKWISDKKTDARCSTPVQLPVIKTDPIPPVSDIHQTEKKGHELIEISWNHPAPSDSNVQYEISYNGGNIVTTKKFCTIQNLEPEKSYNFSIVAKWISDKRTDARCPTPSPTITIKTESVVPVRNIKQTFEHTKKGGQDSIEISWDYPAYLKQNTQFEVRVGSIKHPRTKDNYFIIEGLTPDTEYNNISVFAVWADTKSKKTLLSAEEKCHSVTTKKIYPVTELMAKADSEYDTLSLEWKDEQNVSKNIVYEVYLDGERKERVFSAKSCKIEGLTNNKTYLIHIRSIWEKNGFQPMWCTGTKGKEFTTDDHPALPTKGKGYSVPISENLRLDMRYVPGGSFMMGNLLGAGPRHTLLTKHFWIGKTEVTQEEWREVMGKNPPIAKDDYPRRPVTGVTWAEAKRFCDKLTEMEREHKRLPKDYVYALPTEAQWEYACRAGTTGLFHFGENILDSYEKYRANTKESKNGELRHWKTYSPNNWRLYDMHGNAAEWCYDWHAPYDIINATDPIGPKEGTERVLRGGSFLKSAYDCSSASRFQSLPDAQEVDIGFRVALRSLDGHYNKSVPEKNPPPKQNENNRPRK